MTAVAADNARAAAVPEALLDYLPYLYGRVYRMRAEAIERALRPDLREVEWRVLAVLAMADGIRVGVLSERTTVDRTTLSRVLDGMQARGLLRRATLPGDRRVALVRLAPAGRAAHARAAPRVEAITAQMLAGVGAAELRDLKRLLRRLGDNLLAEQGGRE